MYPEGSIEDAKALQASFQRTRSPRRRGGTRGKAHTTNMGSTNNGTGSRQGNRNGAGQEPIGQHGYPQQHVNPQQHGQPQRVNPQHYEQSQQYGHSQQRGHFPASHDSYAPPQQPQRPPFAQPEPRKSDLLDFNRPLPSQPIQRQENLPPQQHQPTVSTPAPAPAPVRPSLLDEKEEEISQPVMQFTGKNGSLEAQKADVAMNGTDEMEKPVTPPRYGGLSASRWNTENVNHPGSSYMDIDNDSSQEEGSEVRRRKSQQRGLASPGRTVASGMVQGLGLRSSRWGS